MGYENFKQLEKDYSKLYISESYRWGLKLLEEGVESLAKAEIEKNFFTIMLDKANFYMKCELEDRCIDILTYLVDKQFICPLYRKIYEPLRAYSSYIKLKEKNHILREKAQEKARFQYKVFLPEGYSLEKKYPVFFNLHGDCGNMEFHHGYWKPDVFLKKGFIVVYVQSSQVIMQEGYGWLKYVLNVKGNEPWLDSPSVYRLSETSCYLKECYDNAHSDIKSCYEIISNEYLIDEQYILIGGFSGGASAALEIAMENIISTKGFIALCPEDKPKTFSKEKVERAAEGGMKGIFMEGEESLPVADEDDMMKVFNEAGFSYEYYINRNVGHWYPEDLDKKLEQALNFILE